MGRVGESKETDSEGWYHQIYGGNCPGYRCTPPCSRLNTKDKRDLSLVKMNVQPCRFGGNISFQVSTKSRAMDARDLLDTGKAHCVAQRLCVELIILQRNRLWTFYIGE